MEVKVSLGKDQEAIDRTFSLQELIKEYIQVM